MKFRLLFLFMLTGFRLCAQTYNIQGDVADSSTSPLGYATVALMHPDDSTLVYFGVTDVSGHFEIRNVKAGKYLLQSAYLGFSPFYKEIEVPLPSGNNLGFIIMKPSAVNLGEAEITSERIPILLKKDTVEYNAGSFKTKPDAATEELLKKLPGVEVDKAGNIKAQGEEVKNVLVDGKEFFGNDPKVATKNIPADAIDKVQVYDKKSDEAELTGIDDGSRSKTINLLLKDNRKSAWMGDAQAGIGTGSHYEASAKAYRFTKQTQFALLGMINNINKFGFTFRDYIDFNGGMQNMMDGGGDFRITVNDDNSLPVDFGQPVMGKITSGAAGLNYTYEKKKDNRFNISYLGNGADKKLEQEIFTEQFGDGNSFIQNEDANGLDKNRAHRLNFGWRNKPDSSSNIILNGSASLTGGHSNDFTFTESLHEDTLVNDLKSETNTTGNGAGGNIHSAYLKKWNNNWKLFKITGDVSGTYSLTKAQWEHLTNYFYTNETFIDNQFQDNRHDLVKYAAGVSVTRKLADRNYLEPDVRAGSTIEHLDKSQGAMPRENDVDSLSPTYAMQYQWLRPSLRYRYSHEKLKVTITARVEAGNRYGRLNDLEAVNDQVFAFIPSFMWDYEYQQSHRLRLQYESYVNQPTAYQLMPVVNDNNPLQLYAGNQNLKSEYVHDLMLSWIVFDQFSFTSVFAGIRGTYTKDKINQVSFVNNDLRQSGTLANVKNDYNAEANIDFSTPVRALSLNFHAEFTEAWNQGINYVNSFENINTNFIHELKLSIDNRKKEKWDVNVGGAIKYTSARFSVQKDLNNKYFDINYFTEISYTPVETWFISASAEVTQYGARTFNESIGVPLLKASVTRYILKSNRGIITLEAFDILNKNTGIQRVSELNYLQQTKSNIIKRYVMLSFKYRLNKFDGGNHVKVKVN